MIASTLWLLGGMLTSYLIARICRSAKVYISLLLMLLLGYVVGTGVKRVIASAQLTPTKQFVITASNPTTNCSFSAFVWTVNDETDLLSKDTQLEDWHSNNKLFFYGDYNVLRTVEIVNDS